MRFFDTNLKPATHAEIIFALKELCVAAGWIVLESSDGTTYNSAGDSLAAATDIDNANAWFRIEDADSLRELTLQRGATAELWRIKYSYSAGFIGGTPAADETPSATDEQVLLGAGTDAAPTFAALFNATQAGVNAQIMVEGAGVGGLYMVGYQDASDPETVLMIDPLRPGSVSSSDVDPAVVIAAYDATNVMAQSVWQTLATAPGGWVGATFREMPAAIQVGDSAQTHFPGNLGPNPNDAAIDLAPVFFGRDASELDDGHKGVSRMLLWPSDGADVGSTLAVRGTLSHIFFGDFVLPWDGVTTPDNAGASALVDGAATDSSEAGLGPVLEALTPTAGQLSGSREQARFTPVQLTVSVGGGLPHVFAKIGASPHTWHTIFDGTSFAPLFAEHSTHTADGQRHVFSILPIGGWWEDFSISAGEFREAV